MTIFRIMVRNSVTVLTGAFTFFRLVLGGRFTLRTRTNAPRFHTVVLSTMPETESFLGGVEGGFIGHKAFAGVAVDFLTNEFPVVGNTFFDYPLVIHFHDGGSFDMFLVHSA